MKCPHCVVEIHPAFEFEWIARGAQIGAENGSGTQWSTESMACPACKKAIVYLTKRIQNVTQKELVYPRSSVRPKAPTAVPTELANSFNEACLVLSDSPMASAALSRRCLQELLKLQGFAQHDLAKAIDAALASKAMPSALSRNLDAIRNIGNFAAHPTKDTNSGAIVDVEPQEADWNLEVLEGLFDFYYVQPAHDKAKIDALNVKLKAAGRPEMKKG